MNKEIKKLWIQALRSGDYRQTRLKLRDNYGYCCLGVLCDLHAKETINDWDEDYYLGEDLLLPDDVVLWAELNSRIVELPNYSPLKDKYDSLSTMNDNRKSFNEIADVIDRYGDVL